MKDDLKVVYQILKAIDCSYENNDFDYEQTLDLEKMKISKRRLELLLENLIEEGFIKGITSQRDSNGDIYFSLGTPRLTLSGLEYLENNTAMKEAYRVLKEVKGWLPGM